MRLVIREYLGMLRESREFDAIFPDLLLEMNFVPISKPQIGVRQAGVDIAATGNDDKGQKSLWLFVLKRGHLGRKDWNGQTNSVRPSLDEIKDVYIRNHIPPEHANLPIKIVVATTGDFKQDFEQDRVGYVEANTTEGLSYEFWNGDHVSALLEKHLLNEYVLPEEARSKLRSTLALIGESDYTLDHFFALLDILLDRKSPQDPAKEKIPKKQFIRSLVTISLTLAIVCRWAAQEGNLRNAVIACERTLLWVWDSMWENHLTEDRAVVRSYSRLISIYLTITTEYFNKVQDHLHTQDALSQYYSEAVLLKERVFEEIGLIASFGLAHLLWAEITRDEEMIKGASIVAEALEAFFKTHPCSGSPCYDHQSIDICLAVLFLVGIGKTEAAKEWLGELCGRLTFAFRLNKWFPISTDSFDDLLEFEIDPKNVDLSKLKNSSWMIPAIAQWAAKLNDDTTYTHLVELRNDALKECCFQLWYPNKKSEEFIYKGPAHFSSGISEAPMILPATAEEMRSYMKRIHTDSPVKEPFESSAARAGIPWLDFIANRHFRTPMNPAFWQKLEIKSATPEPSNDQVSLETAVQHD